MLDDFKFDENIEKIENKNIQFNAPPPVIRKIKQVTWEEAKAMGIDIDALRKEG